MRPVVWVPDRASAERLRSAADRMGLDLRPLPSPEEWRERFKLKEPPP